MMVRNLSNLKPAEVNHLFKHPQTHINGSLSPTQLSGVQHLKTDIIQVEKAVKAQIQPGFLTKVARLFSLLA